MSLLSLILPTVGQPDSTEDPKVTTALSTIQTWANGNIDATNLANAVMTAYTPVWTAASVNPVLGNGTLAGHSFAIGKCVLVRIYLAIGSTTTQGTGAWALTLPVAAKADSSSQALSGMIAISSTVHIALGQLFSGSTAIALWDPQNAFTAISSASGLGNGNVVTFAGIYESA